MKLDGGVVVSGSTGLVWMVPVSLGKRQVQPSGNGEFFFLGGGPERGHSLPGGALQDRSGE